MLKSSDTVRELIAARDRIDTPDKWCKHALRNSEGQRCINGAILHMAADGYSEIPTNFVTCSAMIGIVAARLYPDRVDSPYGGSSTVSFNNHPLTTHADVMRVLDEAIATAE